MIFPKIQEPFFRMVMFAFVGALCGLVGAFIIGIILGLLDAAASQNVVDGSSLVFQSLSIAGMGALFGALLGGVFGIVRRGE